MTVQPDRLGWGPGWPHCQADKLVTVQLSTGLRLPVRREIATIVAWLCHETERRGYDIRTGETWTYACRPVRGSTTVASFHSWALAVDLNAPANPMLHGRPGWQWLHDNHRTDMPSWLPPFWKAHGFEWGGDYSSRQDAMHVGYRLTPVEAARLTASILGHTIPGDPPPVRPPFRLTRTLHEGNRGEDVREAQNLLIWCAARYNDISMWPGKADGLFGPKTSKATLAFKHAVRGLEEMAGHKRYTFNLPVSPTIGVATFGALVFWASA